MAQAPICKRFLKIKH